MSLDRVGVVREFLATAGYGLVDAAADLFYQELDAHLHGRLAS